MHVANEGGTLKQIYDAKINIQHLLPLLKSI